MTEYVHEFWTETRRTLLITLSLLLIAVIGYSGLKASFRHLWIDVQSIQVSDHAVGEDGDVTVWRIIHNDFYGRWGVTVRTLDTQQFICSVSSKKFEFLKDASVINPVETVLSDVLVTQTEVENCVKHGFTTGQFYLAACQYKTFLGILEVPRCVESNPFLRYEGESAP